MHGEQFEFKLLKKRLAMRQNVKEAQRLEIHLKPEVGLAFTQLETMLEFIRFSEDFVLDYSSDVGSVPTGEPVNYQVFDVEGVLFDFI